MKKVAIYDKWLSTLGGGEKVATVMAETLAKNGYDVDLISSFDVDKAQIEDKMGVDLKKVKIIPWYERSYSKLLPKTKKYDLFINVTYLDHLPSGAKKSIFYVHFPTPIRTTVLGFIKYDTILPFLRKFLIIPEIQSGITPVDDIYTRGGRWLGKNNTIVFLNTPKEFTLVMRIYIEQLSYFSLDKISFSSPNSDLNVDDKHIDYNFNVCVFRLKIKSRVNNVAININIDEDMSMNGFGLVSMTIRDLRFFIWNLIKKYMPRYEMALYGSSSYKPAQGLNSYDLFLSNSEFTKFWTKKYWGKDSSILYPPVDTHVFKPGIKKNIILSVGRFFVGGHSKRHDVLLSVFKRMVDEKLIDSSWELHFVGGVAGGKDHSEYLNKLRTESKGYNVFFHLYLSFKGLKKLFSEAKVYWHATGYGEDPKLSPISFEHFGITVVEAMSSGAVPIVFRGGGLIETVEDGIGYTWNTQKELIEKTLEVIKNPGKMRSLSKKAIEKSKSFSRAIFENRFLDYIKKLTSDAKK